MSTTFSLASLINIWERIKKLKAHAILLLKEYNRETKEEEEQWTNTNTRIITYLQLSAEILIHISYKCFVSKCKGIVKRFKVQLIKVNKAPNIVVAESLKVLLNPEQVEDSRHSVARRVFHLAHSHYDLTSSRIPQL